MAENLTTLCRVKQFMGLDQSQSGRDDLLSFLIDGVSRQIAQHCDRHPFEETTYKKWYDGTNSPYLRLPIYPVTRLYGVATTCQSVGYTQYTGEATFASVNLSSSRCILIDTGTDGSDNITEISTSGKSLSELSRSINAQAGWSFSVDNGQDNFPATQLRPISAGDAKSPSRLEFDGPNDSYDEARVTSETDGMIELEYGYHFPQGKSNIFVWYKAGYQLPTEASSSTTTVPKGLEMVTNMIIRDLYNSTGKDVDTGMKSEKLGDYSYTLQDGIFSEAVSRYSKELWPWCRKSL